MAAIRKQVFSKKLHEGNILKKLNKYSIINCTKCKFIHSMPIPKEKELAKLYQSEFFEIEKPNHLKNIETDIDWWNINFNDKYDIFEKWPFVASLTRFVAVCWKSPRQIFGLGH